jgi:hypothetical protein
MPEARNHWFDLKLVTSVADVILKISAALGIILGVSLHVFRANVRLEALEGRTNPFFQAELDPSVVRDEHAKLGRAVPLAVEVLVWEYNRDNEADLKEMRDSTEPTTPVRQMCERWKAASDAAFGPGFCDTAPGFEDFTPRLRYRGRTYERRLIEANETGRSGVEGMRSSPEELAVTLAILHRAEFGAGRVQLKNTGRAVATDVRLHPPPGYAFVGSDGELFSLQPGRTAVRRLETPRGDRPQTIDRSIGVQWDTGKGFVPGGRNTVLAVCGIVALAIAYALARDWLAFRRQQNPVVEPPMEPPVA